MAGNNSKGGALVAAIDLVGKLGAWVQDEQVGNLIKKAQFQARKATYEIIPIIQQGIEDGKILPKYQTSEHLTELANYLIKGEDIWQEGSLKKNEELMNIGKELWKEYSGRIKAEDIMKKLESTKEQKVDKTGVQQILF